MTNAQPMFAVLMMKKISDFHHLTAAHMHNTRNIPCPSADPARTHLNREMVKPDGDNIKKFTQKRLAQSLNGIRKNAVIALELVLTYTHEYGATIDSNASWAHANLEWVRQHFGQDNIMSFAVHRDERTGHCHALITPMTRHYHPKGADRLAASEYVGDKNLLRAMQDSYAAAMAPFGLSRGVAKPTSGEKQLSIKEFWKYKLEEERDRRELDKAISEQRAREAELTELAQHASKVRTLVDVAERHADVLPLLDQYANLPKFLNLLARNPGAFSALETLYDNTNRQGVPVEQVAARFIQSFAPQAPGYGR